MSLADTIKEPYQAPVARAGMRILVVDDDPAAVVLVSRILQAAGHEVLTAADGAEALRVVLHEGPNIVITDWNMPVMDGLEFCSAVRNCEACGFVYVILMTASPGSEALERAFHAGVDDFLHKPLSAGELIARLRAAERVLRLDQDVQKRNREVHRANAEMQLAAEKLAGANRKLVELATTDELTGLANRRAGMQRLEDAWSLSVRYGSPLACMLIDIDHFKRINDTNGHDGGDLVLAQVAAALKRVIRKGEVACRLGGEEFLIVCPHATDAQAALGGERLRREVEALAIRTPSGSCRVTVSVGVASRAPEMSSPEQLLKAADEAMYVAKRTGRNRTVSAGDRSAAPTAGSPVEPPPATIEAPPSARRPHGKLHLLYVDDAGDASSLSSRAMDADGYRVTHVRSPGEAVEVMRGAAPDVIIVQQSTHVHRQEDWTGAITQIDAGRFIPIITVNERFEAGALAGAAVGRPGTGRTGADELAAIVATLAKVQVARESFLLAHEVHGEQARSMALLLDLSTQLIASTTLTEAMEAVSAAASELTCSSRVGVFMPDADGASLRIDAALGVDDADIEGLQIPRFVDGVDILSGTEAVEFATAADLQARGSFLLGTPFAEPPVVAMAFACSGRPVGMLCVSERYHQRPLSASATEFLGLLGNITASAIEGHTSREARDAARDSIVIALATLAENRDSDTGKHLERVTRYCTVLADDLRACEWAAAVVDDDFVQELARAVPLHDIGKVAIPDSILLKPDRLTDDEKTAMQRHTLLGASTIQSVMQRAPGAKFLQLAEQIAHYHHEWFDGRGYPEGLEGETIPLAARIVAVADVYDALTSVRVYKKAMTHTRAAEIINQASGIQFDPRIVESFNRHAAEFERLARELSDRGVPPELEVGEGKLDYREIVFQA
jgi:diguanylate cyclase (GGDEF)-like protein